MQEVIVFVVVACAALYLGRNIRGMLAGRKSCGSCAARGCSTGQSDKPLPFDV